CPACRSLLLPYQRLRCLLFQRRPHRSRHSAGDASTQEQFHAVGHCETDPNGDGFVDITDVSTLTSHFGESAYSSETALALDISPNRTYSPGGSPPPSYVDVSDVVHMTSRFGDDASALVCIPPQRDTAQPAARPTAGLGLRVSRRRLRQARRRRPSEQAGVP